MDQIESITKEVVRVFKKYEKQGTTLWTYEVAAQDLQYQLGNLTKCLLQLKGFRYKEGLTDNQIKENLADELADIVAEVLFIAHGLNINMTEALNKMIQSDEKKIKERSESSIHRSY